MKKREQLIFAMSAVLAVADASVHAQSTNLSPEVSLLWPTENCSYVPTFQRGTCLKFKALANDPDGSIVQVQFLLSDFVIGVATNAPFEITWSAYPSGPFDLKAVAFDNLGATSESVPVRVRFADFFPSPEVLAIRSPAPGTIFSAPASFEFSAELLASRHCDTGLAEFFLGTNSVGVVTQSGPFSATSPLYSVIVTNVAEGDYELSVRKDSLGTVSYALGCYRVVIHVTKLGVKSSRLASDGRFQFDVVTSFPTNQNVIEASSNLVNWTAISTNVPMTNTFTFTEPSPATNAARFYRAVVPSQ